MSWLKKLVAQVWRFKESEYIDDEIYEIYRLTYIYFAIQNRLSNTGAMGLKRFDNILSNLRSSIASVGESLRGKLLETFEDWLKTHALTDEDLWAEENTRGFEEYGLEGFDIAINKYLSYAVPYSGDMQRATQKAMNELFNTLSYKIKDIQYFKDLADDVVYLSDEEYMRERYGVPEEEDVQEYVLGLLRREDIDLLEFIGIYSIEDIKNNIKNQPAVTSEIITIIYKYAIFPLWYAIWGPAGIDETRETVEKNFEILRSANPRDIGNYLSAINIALNTMHQTGSMLDYVELNHYSSHGLETLLNDLTNGLHNSEWDQEVNALFGQKVNPHQNNPIQQNNANVALQPSV